MSSANKKFYVKDWITFPKIGVGVLRVWQRDFLYFRRYFFRSVLWSFIEPLLYVVAFGYGLGFFVGQIDGIPYMQFLAPAILVITSMQAAAFESTYSSFTKLRVQKTYETIMITPISMEEIVFGEILWGATESFFSVLGVVTVFVLIGVLRTPNLLLALPILALVSLVFSSMAMVVTSYARDYDSFTVFFTLVITPMSLLSGTFFPLSQFPKWAQWLSEILPLSHGVRIVRAIILGRWDNHLWISVGVLAVLAMIFVNWSTAQVRRRLIY